MKESEMLQIADWMKQVMDLCIKAGSEENLGNSEIKQDLEKIHQPVIALSTKFKVPGITEWKSKIPQNDDQNRSETKHYSYTT